MRLSPTIAAACGLLVAASPAVAQKQAAPAPIVAVIDSAVARLFSLGASPGVGIVVVRDTQIIYVKGLGYADAEAKRPVTPTTGFYIASTTKSFMGLSVAMLDLEGKVKLDAPVSRYLPAIKLREPMNPDSITMRSLLTHTHGIGDGPVAIRLAFTGEFKDDAELVGLLAEHVPNPRGRAYAYTNLGYNIAALATDEVLHESWKKTLERMIFRPLGMKQTSAFVSGRAPTTLAMPYVTTPDGFKRIPYMKTDANMQSAGGLITTPLDMGRWLEVHINGGKLDGRQVLPAAAVAEAHKTLATMSSGPRSFRNVGYGLGWQIGLYGTDTILHHGGGFAGFAAHMSFMPQRRMGVAVFANNSELGSALSELIAVAIYDVLAGRPMITTDSVASIATQITRMRGGLANSLAQRAERQKGLPHQLEAYTGRFSNPVMGNLEIRLVDGKLEARMGAAWSEVEIYNGPKNQLRVELFGQGDILDVDMYNGRAESVDFMRRKFTRVARP